MSSDVTAIEETCSIAFTGGNGFEMFFSRYLFLGKKTWERHGLWHENLCC